MELSAQGQSTWNEQGPWVKKRGLKKAIPFDPQLTLKGLEQAEKAGKQLRKMNVTADNAIFVSSPFARALQTMLTAKSNLPGKKPGAVKIDSRIAERIKPPNDAGTPVSILQYEFPALRKPLQAVHSERWWCRGECGVAESTRFVEGKKAFRSRCLAVYDWLASVEGRGVAVVVFGHGGSFKQMLSGKKLANGQVYALHAGKHRLAQPPF